MSRRFRLRPLLLPLVALAMFAAAAPVSAQQLDSSTLALAPAEQGGCTFSLGFKALRDQIPQVVGNCLEDERFNPANGNAEQRTTRGLLVWRKADNWTAFTDGATTWISGPFGLQSRPNAGPPFPWEVAAPRQPQPAPPPGRTLGGFVQEVVTDVDGFWQRVAKSANVGYRSPKWLWVRQGQAQASPCGRGTVRGPGYCPLNETLYLYEPFFQDLWARNWDAPVAVVIAHEWGHHIQKVTGIWDDGYLTIQTELQADCFAGLYVADAAARGYIEPGDTDEIAEIYRRDADDPSVRATDPNAHGTVQQRTAAFLRGYQGSGSCADYTR